MPLNNIVNIYTHSHSERQYLPPLYDEHKLLNDPIQGHITLDNDMVEFIDTPQFQRLRYLKQLGTLYLVFPGASHNRFEHSIGVSHLSRALIGRFSRDQPELNIGKRESRCTVLAGLCHDLGHGPFSHLFDSSFISVTRPHLNWTHEQGSEMMLDYLIDDNNIDIETEDLNLIKDLIIGLPRSRSQKDDYQFMFDIVANKTNSLDVDKFDYIQRDTYNLGLSSSYDSKRLLIHSRVINNEICYHDKEVYNIYEMFHTRYTLFRQIYNHRVSAAIELMIVDVLLAADAYLNISDSIHSAEEYLNTTDDILHIIERSRCPELEESRSIMKRIRTRHLYKFVDEFLIPPELASMINKDAFNVQDLINHQTNNDHLTERDVIISYSRVDYSMKDKNPVDSIRFFSRNNIQASFNIPKERVSYMLPTTFQDTKMRIFTRNPSKSDAVKKAFHKYIQQYMRKDNSDDSCHPMLYH